MTAIDGSGVGLQRFALVLGGTGALGSEVCRGLHAAGVPTTFTYHRNQARAAALQEQLGQAAHQVSLQDRAALRALLAKLEAVGQTPSVLIHCAAISAGLTLQTLTDAAFDEAVAVNCSSALVAAQELLPRLRARGGGDIVLCGGLDRAQSLPLPVHYAATQGMLQTLTMALAKELGPAGIRINLLAVGALDVGLSTQLSPQQLADYKNFSAMRRLGTAPELAKAALFLALRNTYMSGKILAVNGGI